MIIIFIGPPFAGKGTQVELLGKKLNLPVFSMGHLIREAYGAGDQKAIEGFEKYSLKGLHLPISLKFGLLKEKLDKAKSGFILDNFPATQEDLDAFNNYLSEQNLRVDRVFYVFVSVDEMMRRAGSRGRGDDTPEIITKRREIQDTDRISVIEYFRNKGILEEINGERSAEEVHQDIRSRLGIHKQ